MATKYHTVDLINYDSKCMNIFRKDLNLNSKYIEEIKLFMDIDLYLFMYDFEKYTQNIEKIRREFALFNDEEWKKGRLYFLNRLCKRKRIFYTKHFYDNYEFVARENIKN